MNFFKNIITSFKLMQDKEDQQVVISGIEKDVVFRGTNLWILIFAIFIASLGLNVNSTAVIIGAMLISPLMGPIMGIGLSMGINDLNLLKKSITNFSFATVTGLITSTLFFIVSPVNDAHSEILARTQPTIYDVLIAFFGGLAGIFAVSSKQKGNILPGVAIATALMPPLCTAGFGLATLQWKYFFGAFYLFLINTVFIALATLITTKYLHFPVRHLLDNKAEWKSKRIIWVITIITILPSIYFGYQFIQYNRFSEKANHFIEKYSKIPDEYLLNKKINPQNKTLTLTYGGAPLSTEQIGKLQEQFKTLELGNAAKLEIKQGFAYLNEEEKIGNLNAGISEKDATIIQLQTKIDSLNYFSNLSGQLFREMKVMYPSLTQLALQKNKWINDSTVQVLPVCLLISNPILPPSDLLNVKKWLKIRLGLDSLIVYNN